VYFHYPPTWLCVPFEQHPQGLYALYARVARNTHHRVQVENLTGADVTGRIQCVLALAGTANSRADLHFKLGAVEWTESAIEIGQFRSYPSPPLTIPPGGAELVLRAVRHAGSQVDALLVYDITYVP
jgi:hypothetical protein